MKTYGTEDRLASPKAVIDTFARLGYAINAPVGREVVPDTDGTDRGPSMQDIMAGLSTKRGNAAFALETSDADIKDFVSRLAQKKRRRWMLAGAIVAALVAVLLVFLMR